MRSSALYKGFSLVELMVAMVLGLLITAAVTQLFLTNRQTFNLQQGLASVQEQGRFAVNFLSKEMMTAGYGNAPAPFAIASPFPDEDGKKSTDGARFDSIMLLLDGSADGARDCAGGGLNGASGWKYYQVAVEDDGNGVLKCSDSDGNNNVLIDNVEAFQVLYGVSATSTGTRANRYLTASEVTAADNIVSVRFAVLIASDGVAVSERNAAQSVPIFGQDYADKIDFTDGRLRRLFVSTVALRNIAGG